MRISSKIGVIVATLSIVFVTGAPALAISANGQKVNAQAQKPTQQEKKEAIKTKLTEAKLKVCQKREANINNILARIADRGQKQLDLFTSIADKTKTFYTNRGVTLNNYDQLVEDVNAKQAEAKATVDKIKETSVTFKCDGTDPKGTAASFKESLKAEIAALKAYKTSVKNLIVGIKSVQSDATASPTPSATPTPTPEVNNAQ